MPVIERQCLILCVFFTKLQNCVATVRRGIEIVTHRKGIKGSSTRGGVAWNGKLKTLGSRSCVRKILRSFLEFDWCTCRPLIPLLLSLLHQNVHFLNFTISSHKVEHDVCRVRHAIHLDCRTTSCTVQQMQSSAKINATIVFLFTTATTAATIGKERQQL